jgi:glycosyltransferase involved in cell wall biosynthesis
MGDEGSAKTETQTAPTISVVVPVYNSAETISELVRRLHEALTGVASAHELILVDDGSRDASWEAISALAAHDPRLFGIRHARNFGQHNALLTGVRAARYPLIVTLDDDLQNPPEEIPVLLAAFGDDVDVVYGARAHQQHGLFRNLASRLTHTALRWAMGVAVASDVTAFRLFRTQLRDAFTDYESSFVSLDLLLSWGTRRFSAVKVRHEPRAIGRSTYTQRKLMAHAFNMVLGFSVQPLRFASWLGFVATGIGMVPGRGHLAPPGLSCQNA